jgi:hypothetical protein
MEKLIEDNVIDYLMKDLKAKGWSIESFCKGNERGNDIVATKNGERLIIEAKGAKANDEAPTKKRASFDSGQIKTHFGKAIVKILEEKTKMSGTQFAIAHPEDEQIKKAIGGVIPFLKSLDIKHYWVGANRKVSEDY